MTEYSSRPVQAGIRNGNTYNRSTQPPSVYRRRVLTSTVGVMSVGLAGCIDDYFGGRSIRTPIPVSAESQASEPIFLEITAESVDDGRESYLKEVSIQPNESAALPRLSNTDQVFRVAVIDRDNDNEVKRFETVTITRRTQSVTILLGDDSLEIETSIREADG